MYDPYRSEYSSLGSQNVKSSSQMQFISSLNPLESYRGNRSQSPLISQISRAPSSLRKNKHKKSISPHIARKQTTPTPTSPPPPPPPPSKTPKRPTTHTFSNPGVYFNDQSLPTKSLNSTEKDCSDFNESMQLIESQEVKLDLLEEVKVEKEKKELEEKEAQKIRLSTRIQDVVNEVQNEGLILPNSLVFWKFMEEKKLSSGMLGDLAVTSNLSYFQDSCWTEIIGRCSVLFFEQEIPKQMNPGLAAVATFNQIMRKKSNFWNYYLSSQRSKFFEDLSKFEEFLKNRKQGLNFFTELREKLGSEAIRQSVQFNLGIYLNEEIQYDWTSEQPVQLQNFRTIQLPFIAKIGSINIPNPLDTPRAHIIEENQLATFGNAKGRMVERDDSLSQIISCVSHIDRKQTEDQIKRVATDLVGSIVLQSSFDKENERGEMSFKDHRSLFLITLAQKLVKQGKLEAAQLCCQKYQNEENLDALASLIYQVKMVIAFNKQQTDQIKENYTNALESINFHYSPKHPLHIQLNLLMAHIYYHVDHNQAPKYLNQALKLSIATYGEKHCKTLKCREAMLQNELKKGCFLEKEKLMAFLEEYPVQKRPTKSQELGNQFPKWRHLFKQCVAELRESSH